MAKKPYQGQFESMEFPPYEFQEFPKQVGTRKNTAGQELQVVARNAEEEKILLAELALEVSSKVTEKTEKEVLQAKNEELLAKIEELQRQAGSKLSDTPSPRPISK